ncbi:MAG: class I SAM-dependent methyltransferase [Candidatus Dormibacteraceae bacterium]
MPTPEPSRPAASGYVDHLIDFYDAFAPHYDSWAGGVHRRVAARLAELAAPAPRESALDVGTGTGLVAHLLAAGVGRGGQVIGIDLSAGMMEEARRRARANMRFFGMAAERLVFKDASFDVVTYGLTLSFLVEPTVSLAEAYRVLRPGGRVALASLRRNLDTESQEIFFGAINGFVEHHPLRLPRAPEDRADFGEPAVLGGLLARAGFERATFAEMVTGGRAGTASEWVDLMAGSGPLPHTLITALGPRLRRELETQLEAIMAPLGEDAYRHHHAFSFALAFKPGPDPAPPKRGSGGGDRGSRKRGDQPRERRTAPGSIA